MKIQAFALTDDGTILADNEGNEIGRTVTCGNTASGEPFIHGPDLAAHIVKCVNAHDELVAALEESFVYFAAQSWEEKAAFVERARAILAKVKA